MCRVLLNSVVGQFRPVPVAELLARKAPASAKQVLTTGIII